MRAVWRIPVSTFRYESRQEPRTALRLRIRELAHARPRFGYLRIWVLLRREGWLVNRKRVRRLYRLEGLQLRMRVRRRKHIALHRGPAPIPTGPTERWSMDFVHDAFAEIRRQVEKYRRKLNHTVEYKRPARRDRLRRVRAGVEPVKQRRQTRER